MRLLAPVFLLLALGGCSAERASDEPEQPVSQRTRDSAVAQSGLPGAAGVGQAMTVADSAAARRALEDSLARER
jgi:hypothetical protein